MHVRAISCEYSRVSRTRIARASSFPYIIPRVLTQRTIFIPTSNTPNPPNPYIRICFVIIRDDNSLLILAYVLLYHVIFLRIFTSLIPLTFRMYPDYSSISHSRFLSKNGDGVGIRIAYSSTDRTCVQYSTVHYSLVRVQYNSRTRLGSFCRILVRDVPPQLLVRVFDQPTSET